MIVRRAADPVTKLLAAAALLLSILAFTGDARRPQPPLFVSVSIKTLIEEHMVSMIGRDVTQGEARQLTEDYIASLEAAIASLAQDDGVIVLAGEAVLGGGAPDFTDDIRAEALRQAARRAEARGLELPEPGGASALTRELDQLSAATADLGLQMRGQP
jgi:hypothetical protein